MNPFSTVCLGDWYWTGGRFASAGTVMWYRDVYCSIVDQVLTKTTRLASNSDVDKVLSNKISSDKFLIDHVVRVSVEWFSLSFFRPHFSFILKLTGSEPHSRDFSIKFTTHDQEVERWVRETFREGEERERKKRERKKERGREKEEIEECCLEGMHVSWRID